jgi:hypothetical protein
LSLLILKRASLIESLDTGARRKEWDPALIQGPLRATFTSMEVVCFEVPRSSLPIVSDKFFSNF